MIANVALGADPPHLITNVPVAVTFDTPEGSTVPNASAVVPGLLNLQLLVESTVALTDMLADALPAENDVLGNPRKTANTKATNSLLAEKYPALGGVSTKCFTAKGLAIFRVWFDFQLT